MPVPGPSRPGPSPRRGPSPSLPTGLFYILHGDDELGIAEDLSRLRKKLAGGDPAMADLNTHLLSGAQLTMQELRSICDTLPFLSDRRLVIVRGLLSRIAPERKSRDQEQPAEEDPAWKRAFVAELLDYLPRLPKDTRLVFVEGKLLDASHRILKLALERGEQRGAVVLTHSAPKDSEIPARIHKDVRSRGGSISTEAVRLLADLIGPDLRLLDLEIEKLLAYADGRQVTVQDVQDLVSQAREADIFKLTDSLSHHETDKALRILHRLMDEDKEPLWVLAMLARQIRILIQVGELRSDAMGKEQIAKRLGLHPFAVEKALGQVGSFTMAQLEAAHSRLVSTDWAIKTGQIEPDLALDLLVTALSERSG
jgi:DNA polymerase III subunit delta